MCTPPRQGALPCLLSKPALPCLGNGACACRSPCPQTEQLIGWLVCTVLSCLGTGGSLHNTCSYLACRSSSWWASWPKQGLNGDPLHTVISLLPPQIQQLVGFLQAHHPAAHVVLLGLFYMDGCVSIFLLLCSTCFLSWIKFAPRPAGPLLHSRMREQAACI